MLTSGDTVILLNWKLTLPPGHFEHFIFLNQKAKKGVIMPGVFDTTRGKLNCYPTMEERKNMSEIQEIPPGHLSIILLV
jgi:hypothetical protein